MAMTCDLVLASDFRFPGGTSSCVSNEIRALSAAGLRIGLLPLDTGRFDQSVKYHAGIRTAVEKGQARFVDLADAQGQLVVVHNPVVLANKSWPASARVRARACVIVAHQPAADARGVAYYKARQIHRHASELFHCQPVWAPISPVCRDTFLAHEIPVPLLEEDWRNVIFVDDWGTARTRPQHSELTIGRHSRAEPEKWPDTNSALLQAYPNSDDVKVLLLGVDAAFLHRVGDIPRSWTVFPFGAMDVASFLQRIDFFVYYHHPSWIESFGRTIAEAVSAGVVCILPPYLRKTFGPSALYEEIEDAVSTARRLFFDPAGYGRQSHAARAHLASEYGPERHAQFVVRIVEAARQHGDLNPLLVRRRSTARLTTRYAALTARTTVNSILAWPRKAGRTLARRALRNLT